MDKKIVVFDMDDTLLDSTSGIKRFFLRILDEEGISYDADTLLPTINPLNIIRIAACFTKLGVPGTAEEVYERILTYMERFYTSDKVWLMPCAKDPLQQLKAEGARLFVLTATPHRISDACLQACGLYDLFEQVWCTDDFGHTKGETVLFDLVAQEIGCAPQEILFFDDGVTAIRTAREAGWQTCGFMPPHAMENKGMEQAAHTCIVSFEELL